MTTLTVPSRLQPLRTALVGWWRGLALRERRLLGAAALVLGLFLLWTVALAPAWRTLRSAPAERDALETQLQEMQVLAAEAQALRGVAPISGDQARAALQAATSRLGDRAKLSLQGPRAVLTLKSLTSTEVAAWVAEVRAGARARVSEATLNQSAPGRYDGSISVTLGSGT